MIISDRYRFAFVHIPKCAGTYVRKILQPYDDMVGQFSARVEEHPALGLLDYVHIPLHVLREYFPSEFERIQVYSSYAVLRDPFDRFPSSIAQRIRQYKGLLYRDISCAEIQIETEATINFLSQHDINSDPKYIHFSPQSAYLELDGVRIIKNIYGIKDVDYMLHDISELIGNELVKGNLTEPLNQSALLRNEGVRRTIRALRPILGSTVSNLLPESAKKHIRKIAYMPIKQKTPDIFKSDTIQDFISEYYRRDIEMYESMRQHE